MPETTTRTKGARAALLRYGAAWLRYGAAWRQVTGIAGSSNALAWDGTEAVAEDVPAITVRRLVDVAIALPLAILCSPVIAAAAIAIKLIDPGAAFYSQRRVGWRGKPIDVIKIRTMYQDAKQRLDLMLAGDPARAQEWSTRFKLERDPRILPYIGTFLRRSSLDELPQLWNVLRGDMSVIGPRPFPSYHLDAFSPEFRSLRMSVPPGITGLWQISSRSEGDLEIQRLSDTYYIRNRSFWLDAYILLATLPAVIARRGAK